jgi:hypothetical protein
MAEAMAAQRLAQHKPAAERGIFARLDLDRLIACARVHSISFDSISVCEEFPQSMADVSRLIQAISLPDTTQPFDRLIKFNLAGQFIIIFAGMIASFLIAGFWYPYWRVADMDFWVVYNALLLNGHLPQEYFDHPAYLLILLLSYWLRALRGIGLVRVDSFSGLPPVGNFSAFSAVWMPLTQAGRVLSLLLAMGLVAAFTFLLRALVRDSRIAGLGGFLFAFSGGMAMQMRTMRTELLAAGLFTIALLMLLVVAKRGPCAWRPAVIGLASTLIALGMQSKVQVFFMICALPVLLLPFGPEAAPPSAAQPGFWRTPRRTWPALVAVALIALLAVYLAKDIVLLGLAGANAGVPLLPLGIGTRTYWSILAVWLAFGMIAYWIVWRVPAAEAFAAMAAVVAGSMIGLLALYIRFAPDNAIVVLHPLETMYAWAAAGDPRLSTGSSLFSAARVQFLLQAIYGVIARRTFFLQSSSRPTIFLEWFVIAATVVAVRRRQWHLVVTVAALMLTDWGVDLLGMGRHLEQAYFLFTDPLAIVAAALLMARLTYLQQHRWTYPLGVTLISATIVVSQAEPVKHIFMTGGPEVLCNREYAYHYRRLERFPFCPPRRSRQNSRHSAAVLPKFLGKTRICEKAPRRLQFVLADQDPARENTNGAFQHAHVLVDDQVLDTRAVEQRLDRRNHNCIVGPDQFAQGFRSAATSHRVAAPESRPPPARARSPIA